MQKVGVHPDLPNENLYLKMPREWKPQEIREVHARGVTAGHGPSVADCQAGERLLLFSLARTSSSPGWLLFMATECK